MWFYWNSLDGDTGAGMMELDEDSCYRLLFSGPPKLASRGVGLVVRHNVLKSLESFDPISDTILRAGFLTDKGIWMSLFVMFQQNNVKM